MNNKPPTTNTLSYYDAFSNEWVTVITIRHAVEKPAETLPKINLSSFSSPESYFSKSKLEEASNLVNKTPIQNLTLPKISPNSFWNK